MPTPILSGDGQISLSTNASLDSNNGDVLVRGRDLDLQGTIAAGTGIVTLTPTAGDDLSLGAETPAVFSLTSAEVDQVSSASRLVLGSFGAGDVTFFGAIAPEAPTEIAIVSAGIIEDAESPLPVLTATNVILNGDLGVGTAGALNLSATNLSGTASSGGFQILNDGNLNITSVGILNGIDVLAGPIGIEATGTVATDQQVRSPDGVTIFALGDIALNAGLVASGAGNITLESDGDITSTMAAPILTSTGGVFLVPDDDEDNNGAITLAGLVNHGSGGTFVDLSNGVSIINSPIAGSGGLTQNGSGTLVLNEANLFTGLTDVNDGTLVVNGSLAGDVTISSLATLAGTGTISGAVTNDGHLAPGNSPGILNTGNFSFGANSSFDAELGGTTAGNTTGNHDQLNVTGSVGIGSNVTFDPILFGGFLPTAGDEFIVINNDGTDAVTGTFAGLPEVTVFVDEGQIYSITYAGGTNSNDIVLTSLGAVTSVTLDGGNLLVTSNEANDQITIQSDTTNSQFIITDPNSVSTAIGGATGSGTTTVTIPFAAVTGSLITINSQGGTDTVTVDSSLGAFAKSLTINTGSDDDTIEASGFSGTDASLTIDGEAGFDVINLLTGAATGDGDLVFSAEEINIAGTFSSGTGDQTFNGPITIVSSSTINGDDITFNDTVDAIPNRSLTVNGSGVITFGGEIGGSGPVRNLTVTTGAASLDILVPVTITGGVSLTATNGAINVDAQINTPSSNSQRFNATDGITFTSNGGLNSGSSLDMNADTDADGSGTLTFAAGTPIVGNFIDFKAADIQIDRVIDGSNFIGLTPSTDTASIGLGTPVGDFALDDAELANLDNGFGQIEIGRLFSGTHDILIESALFTDNVRIGSNQPGGSITINGGLTSVDNAEIALIGSGGNGAAFPATQTTFINSDINAARNLIIDDKVELLTDVTLTSPFILISGFVDGTTGTENLTTNGETNLLADVGATVPLGSLTVNGPSAFLGGSLTTAGAQTFNGDFLIGNGDAGVSTLNAGGDVTFDGSVFVATNDPTDFFLPPPDATSLVVNTSNNSTTRFNGSVDGPRRVLGLQTNADGRTELAGNVFAQGTIEFNDPVLIDSNLRIESATGLVTFGSTVDSSANGTFDLTLAAQGEAEVQIEGAVGSDALGADSNDAGLGSLVVENRVEVSGGSITTVNDQIFSQQVFLGANTNLTSTGVGNITFDGDVNTFGSPFNLSVNTGLGSYFQDNPSSEIRTNGGDLTISASDVILEGTINTGTGRVTFEQTQPGSEIFLGQPEGAFGPFPAELVIGNLNGDVGFIIDGTVSGDETGFSVRSAGDINDDGFDDVVVGARRTAPGGNSDAGSTYVIFGTDAGFPGILPVTSLNGSNGFVINGVTAGNNLGESVSGAGDINGDGIDDLIIGEPDANNNAGAAHVIFGKATPFAASIDINTLSAADGFSIAGLNGSGPGFNGDQFGVVVSSAGDVNNDGIGDVIIGARDATTGLNNTGAGQAFVIFGSASSFGTSFDLNTLNGANGFVLDGLNTGDRTGFSVNSAGDINGDGVDDIAIGAPRADRDAQVYDNGKVYVVFGSTIVGPPSVDLESLDGTNGFVFEGANGEDRTGYSVDATGDINGDGLDDLIIGSPRTDANGYSNTGTSYVVFGSNSGFAAQLSPGDLTGSTGFAINGYHVEEGDYSATFSSGSDVSGAGDINGDGIDDLLVGAIYSNLPSDGYYGGRAFVVFGTDSGFDANVELSSLNGTNGFAVPSVSNYDYLGISVSEAGDVNGDGFDDVILGASQANSGKGQAYVVFGRNTSPVLSLTDAELDRVTTSQGIQIGNTDAGDIRILESISPANANSIFLTTGGKILTENPGAELDVANLSLSAEQGIGLTGPVNVAVDNALAMESLFGTIDVFSPQNVTVGTVDGLAGVTAAGDLTLNSDGGVTLNSGVTATGNGSIDIEAERQITVNGGVSSTSGAIVLGANSSGLATGNFSGVFVADSATVSSTIGDITVTGHGGDAVSNGNHGVQLAGTSAITSLGGNITLTGQAGGAGATNFHEGVIVGGNVTTTGSGNITVNGTGGSTGGVNIGVDLISGTISAVNGTVTINGVSGVGGSSDAIRLANFGGGGSVITTTGSGTIVLTADASAGSGAGLNAFGAGTTIGGPLTTGDIAIITNTISLAAPVQSTGDLFIEPLSPTTSIGLGGGAGVLNIDDTEFAAFESFGQVNIGIPGTTPLVQIDELDISGESFDLFVTGGRTEFTGTLTLRDDGRFTLLAGDQLADLNPGASDVVIGGSNSSVVFDLAAGVDPFSVDGNFDFEVASFAAQTQVGNLAFEINSPSTIDTVDGLSGLNAIFGGDIVLDTQDLTIRRTSSDNCCWCSLNRRHR